MATARRPAPERATVNDSTDDDSQGSSFESSIQRLGEVVERLESGELPLEESLRLFEEGVRMARASQKKLDRAERRVEELLAVDEEGNPVVREIEPE